MSEKNKTAGLKDEELEKVAGGYEYGDVDVDEYNGYHVGDKHIVNYIGGVGGYREITITSIVINNFIKTVKFNVHVNSYGSYIYEDWGTWSIDKISEYWNKTEMEI